MFFSIHQRIIALVMLMAYAVSGTSALPAAVSLVAWMDGSHSVVVKQAEQGFQVFLRHQSERYTPRLEDHNTALARILVSMCESADSGDHQMRAGQVIANASVRNAEEIQVQRISAFNFRETDLLSLVTHWQNRDRIHDLLVNAGSKPKINQRPLWATVQLLI